MVRIPQGRTSSYSEITVPDGEPVDMPERIVALETATCGHDIAAFLDGRLPFADGNIVQMDVMDGEQRAFPSEFLIFYQLHKLSFFYVANIHSSCISGTKRITESG